MVKISKFSLAIFEFCMGPFVAKGTTRHRANGDLPAFSKKYNRMKINYPDGPPCLLYRSGMPAGSMLSEQEIGQFV